MLKQYVVEATALRYLAFLGLYKDDSSVLYFHSPKTTSNRTKLQGRLQFLIKGRFLNGSRPT
jgi:hypothetical protein